MGYPHYITEDGRAYRTYVYRESDDDRLVMWHEYATCDLKGNILGKWDIAHITPNDTEGYPALELYLELGLNGRRMLETGYDVNWDFEALVSEKARREDVIKKALGMTD